VVTLLASHGVNTDVVELDIGRLADVAAQGFELASGQTQTGFTIDNGLVSFAVTGQGFTYSAGISPVPIGGTISTFTSASDGGDAHYSVAGLDLDLGTMIVDPGSLAALFRHATILGSPEDDYLDGSRGHDTINGGGGNDRIVGGAGDLLTGGRGDEEFIFRQGFGTDIITDFHVGDVIAISHTIFHNFAAVRSHAHMDRHHHVVIAEGSCAITLDSLRHLSNLKAGEFLFT
jgi:Ca2+-binding RTX toxin-like protein